MGVSDGPPGSPSPPQGPAGRQGRRRTAAGTQGAEPAGGVPAPPKSDLGLLWVPPPPWLDLTLCVELQPATRGRTPKVHFNPFWVAGISSFFFFRKQVIKENPHQKMPGVTPLVVAVAQLPTPGPTPLPCPQVCPLLLRVFVRQGKHHKYAGEFFCFVCGEVVVMGRWGASARISALD